MLKDLTQLQGVTRANLEEFGLGAMAHALISAQPGVTNKRVRLSDTALGIMGLVVIHALVYS